MKKIAAFTLVLALLLSCLIPGSFAEPVKVYDSELIDGLEISLYERGLYLAEETADEDEGFPIKLTFGLRGRENDVQIVAYFALSEELADYVTVDLPESLLAQWDQYYMAQYTESSAGLLTDDGKPISVDAFENIEDDDTFFDLLYTPYMASGKAGGNWFINYFGVLYGIQIQVTGQAKEFDDETFSAVLSVYYTAVDYALDLMDLLIEED